MAEEANQAEARKEFAAQLAKSHAAKLKASGLLALVIPATCHIESPETCSFHVVECSTAGVDLQQVTVLQLPDEPQQCPVTGDFGFAIALHLEMKPNVRLVIAYTCTSDALLVPLTRWIIRSPKEAVVVVAPPRVQPDGRRAEMLIYPGDIDELCSQAEPEEEDTIEIVDETVGKRLQNALEKLWYSELFRRQLEPDKQARGPGKLTRSVKLLHFVTSSGKAVCSGASIAKVTSWTGALPRGESLLPLAGDWTQLEAQLTKWVARECAKCGILTPEPEPLVARATGKKSKTKKVPVRSDPVKASTKTTDTDVPQGPDGQDEDANDSDVAEDEQSAMINDIPNHTKSAMHDICNSEDNRSIASDEAAAASDHSMDDSAEHRSQEVDSYRSESADRSESPAFGAPSSLSCSCEWSQTSYALGSGSQDPVSYSKGTSAAKSRNQDEAHSQASSAAVSEQGSQSGSTIGSRRREGGRHKPTRSWADLSENIEAEDEHDVKQFFFETQLWRDQVGQELQQNLPEAERTWQGVEEIINELPNKVLDVLCGAVQEATDGSGLHIPEQALDVPADQRHWSATEESQGIGLLSEAQAWSPPISELGQWYELTLPQPGLICGVVLAGDKDTDAWVEMVKFTFLDEDGSWKSIDNGGELFTACRNACDLTKIHFDTVRAAGLRIYPVVWHGRIALRAALLHPKQEGIHIGDEATHQFRQDAGVALAGISSELNALRDHGEKVRSSGRMSELVSHLYNLPIRVADAATRFESSLVKAWKEKARADEALQQAREWVESIPEDKPLAMAARAQAAAMDQVSEALKVLEELHQVTASSVAESVLRAKTRGSGSSRSETERLQAGLLHNTSPHKASSSRTGRRRTAGASTCTLETVLESSELLDTVPPKQSLENLDFWLEIPLHKHAFRVVGPPRSIIWEPQEFGTSSSHSSMWRQHRCYSYACADGYFGSNIVQTGEGQAGELLEVQAKIEDWKFVYVSTVLEGIKTSALLAPLRLLNRDGMFRASHSEVDQVVIVLANDPYNRAVSVVDGEIVTSVGRQSWEHESRTKHWHVSQSGLGYRFRFCQGGELAAEGGRLVLRDEGFDWKFVEVGGQDLAVQLHHTHSSCSIALLPGGHLEFTPERIRFVSLQVVKQSHCSSNVMQSAMKSYEMEPQDGVFQAAVVWRQGREGQTSA